MEPTQLEDQIKFLVYDQFVSRCVWCYEQYLRDNDRSQTCHLILPRFSRSKNIDERNLSYWKFGPSVIIHIFLFNDSFVVTLKEYKEIHKEARLLQLQTADINFVILKKNRYIKCSVSNFLIQSLQLKSMYQMVIKFDVILDNIKSPFSSCILAKILLLSVR